MEKYPIKINNRDTVLALGAESAGNFSIYKNGKIHFSHDFGNLQDEGNFKKYKKALDRFLKDGKIKPDFILSDLHPLFVTSSLAEKLAKKYSAKHIQIQHHLAHIFSAFGDCALKTKNYKPKADFIGIACDGTGYGFDEKIWGGEIFSFQLSASSVEWQRVGRLENQILLGNELAIKEPARVLISVLSKFLNKEKTFEIIKKHYTKNEFELLWNQLHQNFNCLETSSTARILDAASVLLGFSKNKSLSKHGPVKLLEENSTSPYKIKPVIEFDEQEKIFILKTIPLFEFLVKNINKDKKQLAATAQQYIAEGLLKILKQVQNDNLQSVYFAGGIANNKIISKSLSSHGAYINKKIPRGDGGISFGQLFFYLTNPRN